LGKKHLFDNVAVIIRTVGLEI